jgi:hypothetical protein
MSTSYRIAGLHLWSHWRKTREFWFCGSVPKPNSPSGGYRLFGFQIYRFWFHLMREFVTPE